MRRAPATLLSALVLGAFLSAGTATAAHAAFGSPVEVPNCPTDPNDFVEYDGLLYLEGYNPSAPEGGGPGVSGYASYSFDGTSFELVLGDGIPERPDEECYNMVLFDDELCCTAYNGNPDPLYSWNGTSWTDHFADGAGDVPENMRSQAVLFEGVLYFLAEDSISGDDYLYRFTGTTFEQVTGGLTGDSLPQNPSDFMVFDGQLLFIADGLIENTVYAWNGSAFEIVSTDRLNMDDPIVYQGVLYFAGEVAGSEGDFRFFELQPAAPDAAPELAETGLGATVFGLGAAALVALLSGIAVLIRRPAAAPR